MLPAKEARKITRLAQQALGEKAWRELAPHLPFLLDRIRETALRGQSYMAIAGAAYGWLTCDLREPLANLLRGLGYRVEFTPTMCVSWY